LDGANQGPPWALLGTPFVQFGVIYQQRLKHLEDDMAVEKREFGNLIGSEKVEGTAVMAQTDQRLAR
jgi:hypothetical protein